MKHEIELSDVDRFIVGVIKRHYPSILKNFKTWPDVMRECYASIYLRDMDARCFEDNFLIFRQLFQILMKISETKESDTLCVFKEAFNPHSFRMGSSIEKSISEICGLIQSVKSTNRFTLYLSPDKKKYFKMKMKI